MVQSVGIVGYGACVPKFRIKSGEIARVWGEEPDRISKGLGILEKSVPDVDEDAATILPFDWDLIDSGMPLMVSDYNKGFLREDRLETYKSTPSFIDTKRALGRWAMPYDFIKINQHEYEANRSFCEANKTWLAPKLVVTLGHEGALYMGEHFKVRPAQVFDVTGAGDTFFAAFVASYLKHSSAMKAIHFANECARSVVMERGTSVVSPLCAGFM